jgi:hypothetical protein
MRTGIEDDVVEEFSSLDEEWKRKPGFKGSQAFKAEGEIVGVGLGDFVPPIFAPLIGWAWMAIYVHSSLNAPMKSVGLEEFVHVRVAPIGASFVEGMLDPADDEVRHDSLLP